MTLSVVLLVLLCHRWCLSQNSNFPHLFNQRLLVWRAKWLWGSWCCSAQHFAPAWNITTITGQVAVPQILMDRKDKVLSFQHTKSGHGEVKRWSLSYDPVITAHILRQEAVHTLLLLLAWKLPQILEWQMKNRELREKLRPWLHLHTAGHSQCEVGVNAIQLWKEICGHDKFH